MDKVTHGLGVLLFSWILVVVPLWVALWQGHAKPLQWVVSPVVAVGLQVVAAIAAWIIGLPFDNEGIVHAIVGIGCSIGVGYGTGRYVTRPRPGDTYLRGALIVGSWGEPRWTEGLGKQHDGRLTLAGVPVELEDETKHFKIIGGAETGRPAAIRELLVGGLGRGDRAVIADAEGRYLARFYDASRGDVVLSPVDAGGVQWDFFGEITEPYDVDELAKVLIPLGEDFYAREFLAAAMQNCLLNGKRDPGELWRLLSSASHEDLRPVLAGTPAGLLLDQGYAGLFGTARAVVTSALHVLQDVRGQRGRRFSVRHWVRSGRGVLFIPYYSGQVERLRAVISAWIKLAMSETLRGGVEGVDMRLWFVVEQLDVARQSG